MILVFPVLSQILIFDACSLIGICLARDGIITGQWGLCQWWMGI